MAANTKGPDAGKVAKRRHGHVYLLHMVGTDYYKVGYTFRGITQRITALQTGCPSRIVCVRKAWVVSPKRWERKIHKALADFRAEGEWFKLPAWRLEILIEGFRQLNRKYQEECAAVADTRRESAALRQQARARFHAHYPLHSRRTHGH